MLYYFALYSLLSLGVKITNYGQLSEKVLTLVKVQRAAIAFGYECLGGRRVAQWCGGGGFIEQREKIDF